MVTGILKMRLEMIINSDDSTENTKEVMRSSNGRVKRTPIAGAGLDLVTELVKSGKDISTAGGFIKDFVYSIAAPIFKSLSKDHNVHALKGISRRLISQTGFGTHARGVELMEAVDDGDFRGAIDKMAAHRMKFKVAPGPFRTTSKWGRCTINVGRPFLTMTLSLPNA